MGDDEAADKRRNTIFKLIPSVVKGSWVIKQSVGHTPVLLGKKLKTQYHRHVLPTHVGCLPSSLNLKHT